MAKTVVVWLAGLATVSLGVACGDATEEMTTGATLDGTTAGADDGAADGVDDGVDAGGSATSGASMSGSDGPADSDGGEESTGGGDGPAPVACDTASVFEPGLHSGITVDVDGVTRSYDLFVPTSYDPQTEAALVLNFHGLLGSPTQQMDFSKFNPSAEAHGMLVAYPAGVGSSFNAGVCCGEASSSDVDDVAFARKLVADVSSKMCVDPRRVYATGMSNGGHMAHRLACEAADVFAATASVAGVLSLAGLCTPSRPISMVQFHGTADNIVAYNGFPNVPTMMEQWAARNGCSGSSQTTFDQGDMHCETWPDCDGGVEVTLCTVQDGGHCWPGNGSCLFGHSSTELNASDEIAAMFDEQLMP